MNTVAFCLAAGVFLTVAGSGSCAGAPARSGRDASGTGGAYVTGASAREPDLVDVLEVDPTLRLDIRYATPNNFTGKQLYPVARCLLRPRVAERVARVHARLKQSGLGLKLYDCYRPLSIQRKLWELVPDERYVADPTKGSRHNRGAAVDVTLVDASGAELPMPTEYDDFTPRAHRDYAAAGPERTANRERLERAMAREGFVGLPTEWWHFDDRDWKEYAILDVPIGLQAPAVEQ